MGGSDQWGNILQGVELGRRVRERELFGLTSPLITTGSGAKMGKTASGAVWLSGKRLSAYDYWQYWRNTEDGDVGRFLRMFTDLPLAEISRLEQLKGAEINEAKKILATETTRLCHGDAAARRERSGGPAHDDARLGRGRCRCRGSARHGGVEKRGAAPDRARRGQAQRSHRAERDGNDLCRRLR
jgi:hypothetical protein